MTLSENVDVCVRVCVCSALHKPRKIKISLGISISPFFILTYSTV